ncbi:Uncharacterized protein TCM_038659 [Theobroma cacao]|uniref:Uncharacterized protein n=1 Tax=Theobroma cacao TaxID=3641 RepID=A0A061GX67_THECC|nr:Uncharacterized protein TCM_038659 [Theobroma cacao]
MMALAMCDVWVHTMALAVRDVGVHTMVLAVRNVGVHTMTLVMCGVGVHMSWVRRWWHTWMALTLALDFTAAKMDSCCNEKLLGG